MKTCSILVFILFQTQLILADPCDLPTFGAARLFPAGNGSQQLVMGDFNRDGITDLAVLNQNSSISILLGAGDGTFQAAANISVRNPTSLALADFNGDGKLDLAVSDNGTFTVLMMLGNGDGTFQPGVAVGKQTGTLVAGDFNGDGKPDIAIAATPAYIMLGKGDGTFGPLIQPAGGGIAVGFGIAVGDFNGDKNLDVVTGTTGGILVLAGDGKGNMAAPTNYSAGTSFLPDSIIVGDVNGDKKPDVVTVTSLDHKVSILLGNGNGSFQAPITYPIGDLANGVLIADLNGDGIPDLAVSNHTSINSPGTISILSGIGDGTFQPAVNYNPTVQANWALAAGDFNADGVPDLIFTSIVTNQPTQVGIMLGNGDGTFQSPHGYDAGGALPRKPVIADFNGDGIPDMAMANAGVGGNLSVLLGNPDGTYQAPVTYPTAFGAKSVAVGDMNGDGKPDLVVANGSASNLLVFLGNGDGTFQLPKATGSFFLTTYVTLGDFNNDGKLDAAVVGIGGAQIVLGNGDGTFRASFASYGGTCSGCGQGPIVTADLNGDGNLDLVLANGDTDLTLSFGRSGTVTVLLGKGDGSFLAGVDYTIGLNAAAAAVGDLNGDGIPDLAAAEYGAGFGNTNGKAALAVLLGNGDGTFRTPVKYAAGQGATGVVIGDFDGDGVNDVAVLGRTSKTVTVYLGTGAGDGSLRNALTYGSGAGDPVGFAMADLNADGKPDLIVSDQLSNSILTLMNTYIPGTAASACSAAPGLGN